MVAPAALMRQIPVNESGPPTQDEAGPLCRVTYFGSSFSALYEGRGDQSALSTENEHLASSAPKKFKSQTNIAPMYGLLLPITNA